AQAPGTTGQRLAGPVEVAGAEDAVLVAVHEPAALGQVLRPALGMAVETGLVDPELPEAGPSAGVVDPRDDPVRVLAGVGRRTDRVVGLRNPTDRRLRRSGRGHDGQGHR